jgi:hypothetical protein
MDPTRSLTISSYEHAAVPSSRPGRIEWGARTRRLPFALAGGALALEVATHLVDFRVYDFRIRLLDSGYQWSWSQIAATAAFAAGAGVGCIGAMRATGRRRAWWAIAGLFGFFCIDGATRLHAHIGLWPLIYAPLLGGLLVAIGIVSWDTDLAPTVAAGIGLLFGSLAIHVFGHELVRAAGWGIGSWPYEIKVALKEGTELAGWVLLVPALAQLAYRGKRAR